MMSMRSVIELPTALYFTSWWVAFCRQVIHKKLFLSFSLTRQELPADSISLGVTQLCAHISTSMHLRSARKVLLFRPLHVHWEGKQVGRAVAGNTDVVHNIETEMVNYDW